METPLTAFPPLTTARLAMRPLCNRDAEALQRLTDNPAITSRITFLPSPFTLGDAETLIASIDDGNCFLGVWHAAALIGVVGTHRHGDVQLEIGYWFAPTLQRRGFATEAVSAVIEALRQSHPARQIIAQCRLENEPSWNLLHKLGFRATGEMGERPGRALLILAQG